MTRRTEALKLALDALEEIETLPGISSANLYARRALKAIREALALVNEVDQEQPAQQEPVAWRHDMGEENGGWEYFEEASCPECQPLCTSPPAQRKPLTVDEVWQNDELMSLNAELGCSMDLLMEVVGAIEAAHGITKE